MYVKSMFKRILSISLVFLLLASLVLPVAAGTNVIPDISKSPYKSTIQTYVNRGLIKTYTGGNFKPSAPITRLDFMVMVNKAMSLSDTAQINYSDVKATDWFYSDAQKGALYMKYSKNKMNPYGSLSRIDFAYSLTKLGKMNTSNINTKIINSLTDRKSISASNRGIVSAVQSRGLFKAFADKSFKPNNAVSRAEAVVVLDRLLRQLGIVISDKNDVVTVSSYTWTINNNSGTISEVPYNTTLATFKSNLFAPAKGRFEVYQPDGITIASTLTSGCKVITTSESGLHKTYVISVKPQPPGSDATIKSNMWQINDSAGTISNIPADTSLVTFKSYIMPPPNGSYQIYLSDGYTLASNLTPGCKLITTSENGAHKTYILSIASSTEATITSSKWVVSSTAETIQVPAGTSLAVFKAYLIPPINGSYEVYQSNGTTIATTLENGYKLITTAQNTAYHKTYTISMGSNASVTSMQWTVNDTAGTITNVPSGTTLYNFNAYITPPVGGSFQVYQPNGYSLATTLQNSCVLISTAQDGTKKMYTILMSNANTVTSSVYIVNNTAETITNVPAETLLATFLTNVAAPQNGIYFVYQPDGTTLATTLQTGCKLITTGQDGSHKTYTIYFNTNTSVTSSKWNVNDLAGTITNVPTGTTLYNFNAYINPPVGGSFQVYQPNGYTLATILQNGCLLISTAQNGTKKTYTIMMSAANTVTSSVYTVNDTLETITNVPAETALAVFMANVAAPQYGTYFVYQPNGTTPATILQTGCKLITTGQDGSRKTYTIYLGTNASITSTKWTINDAAGTITNVPSGTTLYSFNAYINPPVGGSFQVYQSNGYTSATTLQTGCLLISTAQDGTRKIYTILMNNNTNTVTSSVYTVNDTAETITNVPAETLLAIFMANVSAPQYGTYFVYQPNGTTPATTLQTGCKLITTGQDGSRKTYTIYLGTNASVTSTKWTVNDSAGTITNVPTGTTLYSFNAYINSPIGGSFQVYQSNGYTLATTLQTGCLLISTAQDGTRKIYTILMSNNTNTVTSSVYIVNDTLETITNVPAETTLSTFMANVTAPQYGTYFVYQPNGTTPATTLQTGYKLITTGQDGSRKTYTIMLGTANVITSSVYAVNDIAETISNVPADTALATFMSNIVAPQGIAYFIYQSNGTTPATALQTGCKLVTTGRDGSHKTYTILLGAAITVTSNMWIVNDTANTISGVPYGTPLSTFNAYITAPLYGTFQVYQYNGMTVASDLQNGYKLITTASDGSRKIYTIIVQTIQ